MNSIKRALISVYDKTGIVPFAKALSQMNVQIISTGGTASLLREADVSVTDVSDVTQFPEMLDGRVKTLHPKIHGGLLAVRDDAEHQKTLVEHGIEPIDLVVVNLYPFAEALARKKSELDTIEMIDIGGPAMIRSAAKNFRFVAVVSDPADYESVLEEIRAHGAVSDKTRKRLAGKVFRLTSAYDGLIADYFAAGMGSPRSHEGLPDNIDWHFAKITDLRYGENPHQKGAWYRTTGKSDGLSGAKKLHGKELSFNNILDLDAAFEMVAAFDEPASCIIKHTSPCGFALGKDAAAAFRAAWACDPLSAFGSIVGFNRAVDEKAAKILLKSGFIECMIAPAFDSKAFSLLRQKKNLRLIEMPPERYRAGMDFDFKKVKGGLLLQESDLKDAAESDLKTVTKKKPTKADVTDLLFAFKVCRFIKSNTIVIARNGRTLGLGMGQPSRVDSCATALKKAGARARGAVLASDGFFPKSDSILLAKKAGIRAIIQPGGSIQDEEVIRAADRAGIAMVFSGLRHFRH